MEGTMAKKKPKKGRRPPRAKKAMDFRISRSSVEGMWEEDFLWAVIEPLWPDASVEDELEHIAAATPGQRAIYVATVFLREVDNGGLEQFFSNSSGMYAGEVRKALRLLEAHEHAAAFEKALKIFPDSEAPVDRGERESLLDEIPRAHLERLMEPLNQQLCGEQYLQP